MLFMEILVGLVFVFWIWVKIRIVSLFWGEDEVEVVNVYFVMNFISYGIVSSLRKNFLRIVWRLFVVLGFVIIVLKWVILYLDVCWKVVVILRVVMENIWLLFIFLNVFYL